MRLACLFSGGKDSTFALHKALQQGHSIECLVTFKSKNPESYMFHTANIHLVQKQAQALGIPVIVKQTEGIKEEELQDLKAALKEAKKQYGIEGVVSGALASRYQHDRIAKLCDELGLESIAPLWQMDEREYMEEVARSDFTIIITAVSAEGLNKNFLGKRIDKELLEKLIEVNKKTRFHLAFEGGEADTFVIDGPIFKKRIEIVDAEIKMESECCGIFEIKKIKLVNK